MPGFIRVDEMGKKAWLSFYDEDNLRVIYEEEVSPGLQNNYPYDRDMGYGAVEILLTKLLVSENSKPAEVDSNAKGA
ncbi:MAG: hypothetical protein L0Y56_10010 [Nitrospira sp.]|nr:hypothetical protein [Nitrospira sp.]